ncbi:MAG: hypothetical protein NXI04_12105 [Planctomycetaceae bacterium]|nr:hypothetical protein [Planctomycetaceae bacterium]
MSILRPLFLGVLTTVSCGCASSQHQLSAVAAFDGGRPQEAASQLSEAVESRHAEVELLRADQAVCRLMLGENRQAEHALHEVRAQLDYLTQKDLREQTTSYLTDDKAVAWTGREFEKRMLDCLLVLSSLTGDRQDAFAYATAVSDQLLAERRDIQAAAVASKTESPSPAKGATAVQGTDVIPVGHADSGPAPAPVVLSTNALAAYLLAAVHSELPMNGDDMAGALEQVSYWHPDSPDVSQAEFGVHTAPDHGTLHVVTFVGRITDWQPESVQPTSAALLLADRILSAAGDHTLPPTVAPVRIARPARSQSRPFSPTHIVVTQEGEQAPPRNPESQTSQTLLDLNRIAHESWQDSRDQVIARSVARRVIKKGVVYATKNRLDVDKDSGADLLLSLGGAAWEALEKPDLRHLLLLPERIDVAVMPLPVGQYQLDVGTGPSARSAEAASTRIEIVNGRNTFVLCFRPSGGVTHVVGGH